jgi:hypothetical protein
MALQLYTATPVTTSGGSSSAVELNQPGNPDLKPERTSEFEGGVDLGFWGNRVSLALTGYEKTTQDALYSETLGWDYSDYQYEVNIGEITNRGLEAQLTATAIETRQVTWRFTLNASLNDNKLVHLAPGLPPLNVSGTQQQVAGYPLYGFWGYREHYADANHDGLIEASEVTLDTALSYMGPSAPTQNASFDTHLSLFHGALTLGALFTYQGGYKVWNEFASDGAYYQSLPEQNVPGSPLWKQARAATDNPYASGFFENGDILRFQEISLTYAMPVAWARAIRVHSLSFTTAVRNLAFWTAYSAGDPSSGGPPLAVGTGGTPGVGSALGNTPNNDIRSSASASIPLARYIQFRLNVGF